MTSQTPAIDFPDQGEKSRLKALSRYRLLQATSNKVLDNVVLLLKDILGAELTFVSLVDETEVFFLAAAGHFVPNVIQRENSLSSAAMIRNENVFINNLKPDGGFTELKNVQIGVALTTFAGAPIIAEDGSRIGTLAAGFSLARTFTEKEKMILDGFAKLAFNEIEAATKRNIQTSGREKFSEELSQEVIERARALSEANYQLKKKNEELDQFAYVASHDLQEPLRKILIFNSIIRERYEVSEEVKFYLNKMSDSAHRMNDLIKSLLEYSRIADMKKRFEKASLEKILKNVLMDYELLIEQKKATISINGMMEIKCIPLQINQLFYNLIGNSLKFTKPVTQPDIKILGQPISNQEAGEYIANPKKNYYKIEVIDNGIGFNPEYATKIFTIFQQLNERGQFGGYGIGLALCKRIIDNHKGAIFARSHPGEGATFVVVLPID